MRRRRAAEQRILFPWEVRGGAWRRMRLSRVRPLLLVAVLIGVVVLVGVRERRRAGVRQTRATLLDARAAVDSYMADHDGGCPPDMASVSSYGHFDQAPRDAWGRGLRLICPGRREASPYELMSDGPDGKPGGLDRIE